MWKSIKFIKIYIYMFSFFVHLFFYIVFKKINLNRKKRYDQNKIEKVYENKIRFYEK